jgi:hypothetical protein
MQIQSQSGGDTFNICYSKLWVVWVQPQYLSVVISDVRMTFISWYIRLWYQELQAEADQKLPFWPVTEFETGQIGRLTLTFVHLWCSMLPPWPSAARVFYNTHRYNHTIDNLIHMKAKCNASVFSQNSFWHLCNVVQLLQVSKLQTEPAMSRFRQVAASELFRDLLWPLHSICLIQSSSICIPNTTREPEQFFICWRCHHRHWQRQWLFLICIMLSSLKKILSRQFYSVYALNLLATYNSSIGCHRFSQSWDPRLVNLLRLVGKPKSGQKAWKGRNPFVVLLMWSAADRVQPSRVSQDASGDGRKQS